jgi:hypothetical protein
MERKPASTERAPSWNERFPWLSRYGTNAIDHEASWAHLAIDSNSSFVADRVDDIADIVAESFRQWTFGALFSFIPDSRPLDSMEFTTRVANSFQRSGYESFSDISALSVEMLFARRNLGANSVENLLRVLAKVNLAEEGLDPDGAQSIVFELAANETASSEQRDVEYKLRDALDVLARWQLARNSPDEPIFDQGAFGAPVPSSVAHARDFIFSLTATAWRPPTGVKEASDLLSDFVDQLSEREKDILNARVLAERPDTLDTIGGRFGVTRERVRQLETRLILALDVVIHEDSELGVRALAVRQRVRKLSKLDQLLAAMPALNAPIAGTDRPAWYVLDKFDDSFESDGTWVAEPSLQVLREELKLRFQQVSNEDVADFDALAENTKDWSSLSRSDLHEWLAANGYRRMGDHYIAPNVRSVGDLAAAFLQIRGVAATADFIHETLELDRSIASLRNALASDERFVRSDVKEWGLREWGVREYVSIRTAIQDTLRRHGDVLLDDLIEELTGHFNVSPRSITTYANTWPFETSGGRVTMAKQPKVVRRPFSRTRNLYHTPFGTSIRVSVNSDHLRGSGFPMPASLATAIGLTPGEKRRLATADDPVVVTWVTAQPSFGSIRKQLVALDCGVGDEVFIDIRETTLSVRRSERDADKDSGTGEARALLGLGTGVDLTSSEVATVLGLSPTSPWATIIHVLRDRGDDEVASLLSKHAGDNPAFDEDLTATSKSRFAIVSIDDPEF